MLTWLKIKDLALIADAEIDFSPSFNIITGETGTGKSIIMNSIGLLLGERAGKQIIRTGAKRCEISAEIQIPQHIRTELISILDSAGVLPEEDNIYIKRIITPAGSRNFINDTAVTLQTLKKLGDMLIDIHGPYEHQSLLRPGLQMRMLDRFGKLDYLTRQCKEIYESIESVKQKRNLLLKNIPSPVEAEHLRAILNEISTISPLPDEDSQLSIKYKIASSARDIKQKLSKAIFLINESESSVTDIFGEIYRDMQEIENIDKNKGAILSTQCSDIINMIREFSRDMEQYADSVEIDEGELMEIENRMTMIQNLKRKYGYTIEEVLKTEKECKQRLTQYEERENILNELDNQEKTLLENLKNCADILSEKRKKIAEVFSKQVNSSIKKLGFKKANFHIEIRETKEVTQTGKDMVEFMFSANPGEPAKTLRDIASSGELSRVMLAIKSILAEADTLPILIFDEIDVNIGGTTAMQVASALKTLSETHQLICISHLPTVAAKADTHFKVDKTVERNSTQTIIKQLSYHERIEELARMLGSGKSALTFAKELIKKS